MGRKNQAVRFSTVAKVLLVSFFLGGSGVGYVLQKSQIRQLRMESDKHAAEIELLKDAERSIDAELVKATQKEAILHALRVHGIQLGPAEWENIVTVWEPDSIPAVRELSFAGK